MNTFSRVVLSLFIILSLCGLSSRFTIKVSQLQGHVPNFQIMGSHFGTIGGNVEINSFLVVKKDAVGQWDYKHPVWTFRLPPGSGKELSKFTYGEVPSGFVETTRAMKLTAVTSYLVLGFGMGSDGSAQFTAK